MKIKLPKEKNKKISTNNIEKIDYPIFCLKHLQWHSIKNGDSLKHKVPAFVTPDVKTLWVFRYTGNNLPFLALRNGNILHVIFIEAKFGDIYNH